MSSRFPLLSFVSSMLKIFGCVLIVVGLYYGLWEGIIEPNQPQHRFEMDDLVQLFGGALSLWCGIVAVAFGEVIGVLFAIEENTRATVAVSKAA